MLRLSVASGLSARFLAACLDGHILAGHILQPAAQCRFLAQQSPDEDAAAQTQQSDGAQQDEDAPPAPTRNPVLRSRFAFDDATRAELPSERSGVAPDGAAPAPAVLAQRRPRAQLPHAFRQPAGLDDIPAEIRPHLRRVVRKRPEPRRVPAVFAALRDGDHIGRAAAASGFDPSVDCSLSLTIDPRKSDQLVRGTVDLPHGSGRAVRVAVFADGAAAEAATAAGAAVVGAEQLITQIAETKALAADVVVATPELQRALSKVARILGPRGLMPNPKYGTVTDDVAAAVTRFKRGNVQFRNDRGGNVAASIGRKSFDDAQLAENFYAFVDAVMQLRPKAVPGVDVSGYVERVTVSTTQGKGFPIVKDDLAAAARAKFVSGAAGA